MKKRNQFFGIIKTIGWFLFRVFLLNAIVFGLSVLVSLLKNWFNGLEIVKVDFPFQLYITSMFLVNLVYCLGMIFDVLYYKLWNKDFLIQSIELKFFKIGVIMSLIVHLVAILLFFIKNLNGIINFSFGVILNKI